MLEPDVVPRIDPEEVRRRRQSGEKLLLVCAYDDEAKCRDAGIDGALTLRQLDEVAAELGPDAPLVFYCA
jgi:hypothetical protein